ncbi:MAG: hypothetical protein V8Q57_04745 [Blautia sp.]
MREKFIRFMQGRYGVDEFAKFTIGAAFVVIVITLFTGSASPVGATLNFLGLATIVYTYFRIFSKNIQKRYEENQKFLSATAGIRNRFRKGKKVMEQRKEQGKEYRIYTCPSCGQIVRIPRGNGKKVEIQCPKCHSKFIKRR